MQPICKQPEPIVAHETKVITVEESSNTKTKLGKFCGFVVEPPLRGFEFILGECTDDALIRCCSFYPSCTAVAFSTPQLMVGNCNPAATFCGVSVASYVAGCAVYHIVDGIRKY